ncbi:MAG: ThuA domain-containing protein [Erythrobacter sp.]|nr:MAG: ThuA domain-containing protein [Erythrobacter sp.]
MKFVPTVTGALLAACLALPAAAQSAPVIDCPLRDAPFSASTPVIDIMLNEQARGVLRAEFGEGFDQMPEIVRRTDPPSFGAILTVREFAGWGGVGQDVVDRIVAGISAVEVTDADRAARCARYDDDVPTFTFTGNGPRILMFEKINGFRDGPSVDAAHAALLAMAEREGWQMVVTQSGGAFNAETLAQFDAVIWNNISGDVLTLSQRQAFRDYIEEGGAFVGVHGTAGDPVYFWDWYADTLIGARFAGHPRDPQFQDARVVVDDPGHPAAASLPAEWVMRDEWYSFRSNPRDSGSRIIATLDESTYEPTAGGMPNLRMGDDHPIAWSRIIGQGRMFYSAIGHMPETYSHPTYVAMLEDVIAWAVGEGDCACDSN